MYTKVIILSSYEPLLQVSYVIKRWYLVEIHENLLPRVNLDHGDGRGASLRRVFTHQTFRDFHQETTKYKVHIPASKLDLHSRYLQACHPATEWANLGLDRGVRPI